MSTKSNMIETKYRIKKMDCPSEAQMIELKLEGIEGIKKLQFDIPNRMVKVYHVKQTAEIITKRIDELNLDSSLIESAEAEESAADSTSEKVEKNILWIVLAINFGFFLVELTAGIIAKSMGLVADSLDMFADAAVYGMSLLAIGKALSKKKLVAKLSGYFQFILAVIGFVEVVRRFIGFESLPNFQTMIIVSILALIGNLVCLYLLQESKNREAHMQASMIFTSNDIMVNIGIITAGVLVSLLDSNVPDLVIGVIVFTFVIRGAFRIIKLAQ